MLTLFLGLFHQPDFFLYLLLRKYIFCHSRPGMPSLPQQHRPGEHLFPPSLHSSSSLPLPSPSSASSKSRIATANARGRGDACLCRGRRCGAARKKRPLVVRSWSTVKEVKGVLKRRLNIPVAQQQLFFRVKNRLKELKISTVCRTVGYAGVARLFCLEYAVEKRPSAWKCTGIQSALGSSDIVCCRVSARYLPAKCLCCLWKGPGLLLPPRPTRRSRVRLQTPRRRAVHGE